MANWFRSIFWRESRPIPAPVQRTAATPVPIPSMSSRPPCVRTTKMSAIVIAIGEKNRIIFP
jgi:hypothetical protein